VKRVAVLVLALGWLAAAPAARAQLIPPLPVTGPAQGALQQLHPPSPLDQVREQSMRRSAPAPLPAPPTEQWVPERRQYVPELGRSLIIPGHYERRLSNQESQVPSLPAYDPENGVTVTIPGGNRPPADVRQGP
jgi:hypothetical protein